MPLIYNFVWVILIQRSCAGNQRFYNLISRVKDIINMEEM